jgi:hypothetical protein
LRASAGFPDFQEARQPDETPLEGGGAEDRKNAQSLAAMLLNDPAAGGTLDE